MLRQIKEVITGKYPQAQQTIQKVDMAQSRQETSQTDWLHLSAEIFKSGVYVHRSFSGADIGSDNDLVMMTFRVRMRKTKKPTQSKLRFDLEKLRCVRHIPSKIR